MAQHQEPLALALALTLALALALTLALTLILALLGGDGHLIGYTLLAIFMPWSFLFGTVITGLNRKLFEKVCHSIGVRASSV